MKELTHSYETVSKEPKSDPDQQELKDLMLHLRGREIFPEANEEAREFLKRRDKSSPVPPLS